MDPEPSRERVGDWGGPETVWVLFCFTASQVIPESGGRVIAAIYWAASAQRRCHPQEALYLPTFSHLLVVNKLFSLCLSLSLSLSLFRRNPKIARVVKTRQMRERTHLVSPASSRDNKFVAKISIFVWFEAFRLVRIEMAYTHASKSHLFRGEVSKGDAPPDFGVRPRCPEVVSGRKGVVHKTAHVRLHVRRHVAPSVPNFMQVSRDVDGDRYGHVTQPREGGV